MVAPLCTLAAGSVMHWRRPHSARFATLAPACANVGHCAVPHMLLFQQERDEAGGGVALRFAAEAALERSLSTPGLRRQEAKALVLRCFDRLLSDDARCAAYEDAIDAAVLSGARTACVLGSGSLLPALLLARAEVAVCVVEPVAPLADIARACARDNQLRVAVLPTIAAAARVWKGPPDLLISEAVDDGLLGERIIPQLREARRTLAAAADVSSGATRRRTTLLPCRAQLSGLLVQLGFEGVRGFGLDGLGLDLRHFDALRPSGQRATVVPGYWPVRLSGWRQPHALLSSPFALGEIDFDEATAPDAPAGAGGVGGPPSAQEVVATRDGLLNAVVYYYNLHMGPGAPPVSSAPPGRADRPGSWRAGWRQAAVYLERPVYVRAGERLTLGWRVSEDGIRFDLACMPPSPGPQGDTEASPEGAFVTGRPLAGPKRRQVVAPPPPPPGMSPSAMVPCNAYHFCMLADTARNEAYRRAIGRAVSRFKAGCAAGGAEGRHGGGGCRILDIGAGSGLLGVMAAQAGATHIDAVEMNRVMAETAARTLEASGVKSFRVYGCLSTQLTVKSEPGANAEQGVDGPAEGVRSDSAGGPADTAGVEAGAVAAGRRLASRADIIVSETLDTSLIGEGAIHSLRHAAAELLRQDGAGRVIPAAATVYMMAVEFLPPDCGGFDFRALDALREGYAPLRLHTVSHACLSTPTSALKIRFGAPATDTSAAGESSVALAVVRRGVCNAIVWWFDLHLDEVETLSVAPGSVVRTWKQNVHYLAKPLTVERGDVIDAAILNHQDDNLHISRAVIRE